MIPRSELLIIAIVLIIAGIILGAYPVGIPELPYALIVIGVILFIVWVILVVTRH
jgi:hypothetical protein